jgi:hypothetical protein
MEEVVSQIGKEHRPGLFKSLQESGELWKALTSRFSYPALQCGKDWRLVFDRGEQVRLLSGFGYLFAQLRLIIKRKCL